MKLSILFSTTVLAALVSAQSLSIPACATDCIANNLPASCSSGSPECICNTASFIEGISCCIFNACNTADQAAALAYAHGVCDPVGASSLLPASAGCSSTSGSGNGTAAATGSSSTTGSGSSSAPTTASGSGSSASSSVSSRASSASSAASASAASATSSPAAGDKLAVQGLGAVGAAVLGLAAFL